MPQAPQSSTQRYDAVPHVDYASVRYSHWDDETARPDIGEGCVQAYLNPPEMSPGCAAHVDPDCLCDVDVSKTAGMTFDQVPEQLYGVYDAEDLLQAAASIWMEYDIDPHRDAQQLARTGNLFKMEEDELAKLVALVRTMATFKQVKEQFDIHRNEFVFLRRATEVSRPFGHGRAMASQREGKILRMHKEGLTVRQMLERLATEDGMHVHDKTLRRFLESRGLKHNPAKVGRPHAAA